MGDLNALLRGTLARADRRITKTTETRAAARAKTDATARGLGRETAAEQRSRGRR